jgi:hypothetical protein
VGATTQNRGKGRGPWCRPRHLFSGRKGHERDKADERSEVGGLTETFVSRLEFGSQKLILERISLSAGILGLNMLVLLVGEEPSANA